jgi:t-SNARE complex subunit (syntaxin)
MQKTVRDNCKRGETLEATEYEKNRPRKHFARRIKKSSAINTFIIIIITIIIVLVVLY